MGKHWFCIFTRKLGKHFGNFGGLNADSEIWIVLTSEIFRDVMGQPAADLASNAVEWAEYGIVFKSRPSPYDFPAFEKKDDGVSFRF